MGRVIVRDNFGFERFPKEVFLPAFGNLYHRLHRVGRMVQAGFNVSLDGLPVSFDKYSFQEVNAFSLI